MIKDYLITIISIRIKTNNIILHNLINKRMLINRKRVH